jgi:hypothetical protein
MKSIHRIINASLVLAAATILCLPAIVSAQEKGAEQLTKLKRLSTVDEVQKVEAGDTIVMSCPKCKDTWVTVVEAPGKTGNPPEVKHIVRHECPGCHTKIVTEGVGKQATDKVVHTCAKCGSEEASCCVMKKGTCPTKDMEQK